MVTIGLTGGLGSGKSSVLAMFTKLGAQTISCDNIVHELLLVNEGLKKSLRRIFGNKIFKNGKVINRKLAKIGFSSKGNLIKLNRLVHPLVKEKVECFIDSKKRDSFGGVVVVEMPLLFEAQMENIFDVTIVVTTEIQNQRTRIKKTGKLSLADMNLRMRYQLPLDEKASRCDFVIDNNGTKDETFNQVKELMIFFKKRWR